jgi:hypothetical protein
VLQIQIEVFPGKLVQKFLSSGFVDFHDAIDYFILTHSSNSMNPVYFFATQCKISGIDAIFLEYGTDNGVPKEMSERHNICDDGP